MIDKEYQYNPLENKKPKGTCEKESTVTYAIKIAKRVCPQQVFFTYCNDKNNIEHNAEMQRTETDERFYTFSVEVTYNEIGLYWYYFKVTQRNHTYFLQKSSDFSIEPTGNVNSAFAQIVHGKITPTPKSYKQGVIYHIFVDRFNKVGKVPQREPLIYREDWGGEITKNSTSFDIINREYFGGNLKGIESKLDYLKSLNVSTIYLSPVFEANSYHKYDTANYEKIDSCIGGEKAFQKLIDEAKKKDISIIIDGVFNHTGSDSIYFNKNNRYNTIGAYQNQNSQYSEWYTFTSFPNEYKSWWGVPSLPEINENSDDFIKYITSDNGIIDTNMKKGLAGFRLDVVDEIGEPFLKQICKAIQGKRSEAILIGEVWEDASTKIAYDQRREYFFGEELNSVMNYPLKNALINYITTGNTSELSRVTVMELDQYPKEVQNSLMNIIGTHDTKRILSSLEEFIKTSHSIPNNINEIDLLKIITLLQYTYFGVPCIFYGDEAGIKGSDAPFCRQCYPWNNINLKISMWYNFLSSLRKQKAINSGSFELSHSSDGIIIITRKTDEEKIIIVTNCGKEEFDIEFEEDAINLQNNIKTNTIETIKPYQFGIYIIKDKI